MSEKTHTRVILSLGEAQGTPKAYICRACDEYPQSKCPCVVVSFPGQFSGRNSAPPRGCIYNAAPASDDGAVWEECESL